jgi:ATP-dependent helicase/nuclease subunit A
MGLFARKSKLDVAREETWANQAAAADPAVSAWVSANAGTGKTHVLSMRLLRLLLAGTAPERILALTYTKAAAAEMAKRVFERLAEWVTADERTLKASLKELLGRAAGAEELQRARQLFAVAIETPGGLKVQTIHAFCERLLQRFPLEAGVAPGFAILDEHERAALLAEAANEVLAEATAAPDLPLAKALKSAVAYASDHNFDALLSEALREQAWLDAAVRLDHGEEGTFAEAEKIYRRALQLGPDARLPATEERMLKLIAEPELRRLRDTLAAGSSSDLEASERVAAVLGASGPVSRIEALCKLFLTGGGDPRQRLMTKALGDGNPDALALLARAQAAFVSLNEERCRLQLLDATMALLRLADAVMQRYAEAKARRAALDFDDLVGKAASLLGATGAVEWVLYKLDGGLDHILVDEAQDTSPVQWQVIRALAEEFFVGAGAREAVRTLFAVGDEKQSIYSFQGAAPSMFAETGKGFAARAAEARLPWRRVPLTLSFRAVEPLLAAVDRIFADRGRTAGVTASDEPIRHIADRAGHAGLIEVWPTAKRETQDAAEPWSPLEEESAASPVLRLAARIADTIAGWLETGERLASEDRPIRAGDILILVRKRAPFAPVMVSALKARGIKVAGSDRLVLADQIAVQDLIALGDVLTLPEDDLALAALLKSPLIGLDDDDLLALAPKREGSLWQELMAHAPGNPRREAAAAALRRWRARAGEVPPFEFYASVLDGEGGRARMLARLGAEAADALDEFLNLALAYEETAPPSLQGFLSWLRQGRREIKRDMEQGRDEVRVMTVHGAKGLEAPIVFLPDTCSTRSGRSPSSLLKLEAAERPIDSPAPFLWPVKGTSGLAPVQQAKQAVARIETEERNRLLYVALTRARDRLYVAGFENGTAPPADCWYNLIRDGLAGALVEAKAADGSTVWRIESEQSAAPDATKREARPSSASMPLPAWARRPAPTEPLISVPLAPSKLAPLEIDAAGEPAERREDRFAEPPILPPVALAEDARFLRGTLTHALLEHLPALPAQRWETAADAFLASRAAQLPVKMRKAIAAETLSILRDPKFTPLFGPDSRAEVAIAAEIESPDGTGPALRLAGKIDRLVQVSDGLLIVDYKTNRPPPADPAGVADAYLLQLAAYRLAVARIFGQRNVRAAILWTDGPRIMEIPAEQLDAHQQRLWQLDPASLDAQGASSYVLRAPRP